MAEIEIGIPIPEDRQRPGDGLTATLRELMKAPIGASAIVRSRSPNGPIAVARNIGGRGWCTTRKIADGEFRAWKIAEPTWAA